MINDGLLRVERLINGNAALDNVSIFKMRLAPNEPTWTITKVGIEVPAAVATAKADIQVFLTNKIARQIDDTWTAAATQTEMDRFQLPLGFGKDLQTRFVRELCRDADCPLIIPAADTNETILVPVIRNNKIESITVPYGGTVASGALTIDAPAKAGVARSAPNNVTATAAATYSGGVCIGVEVTNGGEGYGYPRAVRVYPGDVFELYVANGSATGGVLAMTDAVGSLINPTVYLYGYTE